MLFVSAGVIAIALGVYFFFMSKDVFLRGMGYSLIAIALIQIVVGSTVWVRSPKDIERVNQVVKNEPAKIQIEEIPRMETVMKSFVLYRYIEVALIIAGLILMFFISKKPLFQGIGMGLFIQASLMLLFDFFAEKRGFDYLDFLKNL